MIMMIDQNLRSKASNNAHGIYISLLCYLYTENTCSTTFIKVTPQVDGKYFLLKIQSEILHLS